ncbi:MAG TPA: chemotaxis protein CheA, partial [Mobilitalea sp.]|nr:chemotaxis protein CheA [Mobilitalea sp.]
MADFYTNDAMVDMYLFETTQLLEQLEQVILQSDSDCNYSEESINEIFRIMHTIKGSSAMMMYEEISDLAHNVEDLFFYLRQEKPKHYDCSSLNDLILDTVDFIKLELEKIRSNNPVDGMASSLKERLRNYLSELKNTDLPATNVFKAVIYYEEGCEMENVRAFALVHNLKKYASELIYYPQDIMDNDSSVDVIRNEGFRIYFKTQKSQEEVYAYLMQTIFLKDLDLTQIDEEAYEKVACGNDLSVNDNKENRDEITRLNDKNSNDNEIETDSLNIKTESNENNFDNENNTGENSSKESNKKTKEKAGEANTVLATQNIISVSVAKLDKLMDLVGEMVIAEAMVLQNPDLDGLELSNFQKAASQLSKITAEIQDMVMSVRMVPLSATFHRMNRIVRDMCRKLGKEVNLEIIGEETEVDKNIIEHITDPLMHLVRNSVDHGIESVEERKLLGKPVKGTVTIEAKSIGSDVHIIIRDDGRGLDKDKILAKAREKNLLNININEQDMTDSDIYKLILLPGFSTKDDITEFSGRGVGMDVVSKNIETIGGSILIESEKNKGTQFTLKIPLTLAIIDGMNQQVG